MKPFYFIFCELVKPDPKYFSTMAANVLARDFKIPMKDYVNIDISPDVHVKRVFKRLGFISKDASNDELIYCARELNQMYLKFLIYLAGKLGEIGVDPISLFVINVI